MGAPLNVFRTYTADLTTTPEIIYTAPAGHTSVVLLAQVSNLVAGAIQVSGYHVRGGNYTTLVYNTGVPQNDAVNILSGKLVLETGDAIAASASADGSAQIVLSILETLNP